jgi:hypothetical protein
LQWKPFKLATTAAQRPRSSLKPRLALQVWNTLCFVCSRQWLIIAEAKLQALKTEINNGTIKEEVVDGDNTRIPKRKRGDEVVKKEEPDDQDMSKVPHSLL